ncbi:MAG: aminotransferase class I/II-fold pyridoxal phosphate-dependent enzyme [Myxococcota bacterium]
MEVQAKPRPVPQLQGQSAYRVLRHPAPVDLRLDGNEGPAPDPELLSLLTEGGPEIARRYPLGQALVEKIVARFGVAPEQVIVTAGADDAMDRCCRAFLCEGRELIMPSPTFEMIGRYARLVGARTCEVPWPGGDYPLEAVVEQVRPQTSVIAFVSPNNPTGAVGSVDALRKLSEAAPHALILVDLAYGEFADEDLTQAALALPNAVVLRTMSKAWGLAGLRVGFALGPSELIDWLRVAGQPYAVSGPSLALAAARLESGEADVNTYVARVRSERRELERLLTEAGAEPHPSQGNFVFARSDKSLWIRDALAGLGIAVRIWPNHPQLDGTVRISCPGSVEAFERLTHALRAALMPRALLLDMDGVLANVSQSYRLAIVRTAAHWDVEIPPREITEAKTKGNANNDWILTHALLRAHGVDVEFEQVKDRFEQIYQGTADTPGIWESEVLIPERAALERLAKRMPLGLVTGRPRGDAERFLAAHDLDGLFQASVCMYEATAKPDPAPVRLALERLGVRHAWMVGDTPDDQSAARAAGVVPLAVVAPGDDVHVVSPGLYRAGAARVLQRLEQVEEMLP